MTRPWEFPSEDAYEPQIDVRQSETQALRNKVQILERLNDDLIAENGRLADELRERGG